MKNINVPGLYVKVEKTSTPGYYSLISRGTPLPENPYSLIVLRYNVGTVNVKWEYGNGTSRTDTLSDYNFTGLDYIDRRKFEEDLRSRLNNQLLEKVKGQSLPVIQLYAERKETAKTLSKLIGECIFVARNVRRPAKIFKRYNRSRTSSLYFSTRKRVKELMLKDHARVGDAWLQYRMFLTPFYHDVMTSLKSASDYEKKTHSFHQRASTKVDETVEWRGSTSNGLGIPTSQRPGRSLVKGGAQIKVHYQISDQSLAAVTSFADPLASGWDLLQWTFIVDRFVDIGSFLELRNATLGTTFISGSISSKFTWTCRPEGEWVDSYYPNKLTWGFYDYGYKVTYVNAGSFPFTETSVRRIPLTNFPPVQLEFPFRQGWKQVTDEIVLLRKLLYKRL